MTAIPSVTPHEQGRPVEVAVAVDRAAAGHQVGALFAAGGDQEVDVLAVLRRHQRPELGAFLGAGAEPQAFEAAGELVDELLLAFAVDVEARVGRADLAGVERRPGEVARDGGVDVGVGRDDARRLAAELQGEPLEVGRRARRGDQLPDGRRAGVGEVVDAVVLAEHRADGAVSGDEVDDTRRDPGFVGQFDQADAGQGRDLARLDHHGVAGGEQPARASRRGSSAGSSTA